MSAPTPLVLVVRLATPDADFNRVTLECQSDALPAWAVHYLTVPAASPLARAFQGDRLTVTLEAAPP